ncbi:MAG: glycosyltransferase family 87 protein, partial [Planctomycetota bacterium]|nr:glycosyltransferase family 87 protein [Planctomycetota bacterium]
MMELADLGDDEHQLGVEERRANRYRRFMMWVVALGVAVLVVQWFRIGVRPRGDFHLHWEMGRRMAAHTFIYEFGDDYPYPPFWGLAHAPLSAMPMHAAQVFLFPQFVGALALLVWSLRQISRSHFAVDRRALFWATAAAFVLVSRYLVRDMLECGVNLLLVALSYYAVSLWSRHQDWRAGWTLGLAIALKCTPVLFALYFLWKRQWKVAFTTGIATIAFSVSPILWMGSTAYVHAMRTWTENVSHGVAQTDPSRGITGEEPIQNLALRPALARFLMRLPAGHNLRHDHPLSIDFLDLSPPTAGTVVRGLLFALVVIVAWKLRPRDLPDQSNSDRDPRHSPAIPWECAAISVSLLLYSPITWGQHCVGILPAMYLVCCSQAAGHGLPVGFKWIVGYLAVTTLLFNREFLGMELTQLVDSYHLPTWGLC